MIDYFPLSTAHGAAFCNRKEELAHLDQNTKMARPTLIMSPRRYGKTSLALRSFELSNITHTRIDFYKELNAEDIERAIINGVGTLLGKIESKPKQLLNLASEFFADMHVNVVLNQLKLSIEVKDKRKNPADNIQEALEKLHTLAKKKKLILVFFIDEFQRIAEITDDHSIEAAIRNVAQTSQHIAFIFSGSNRHLMQDMFFDSHRPFYKMCDIIRLDRITANHYIPYIQKAAKQNWKKKLSEKAINSILQLTECHPYYVNFLCSKLWLGRYPDHKSVITCWLRCAEENRSQAEKEIDLLSLNQKRLLISLARFGATKRPTSQSYLKLVGMPSTTVSQALAALLEKDYLYKNKQGDYCILDPLLKQIMA